MIALFITAFLFTSAGGAAVALLRLPALPTRAGRLAFCYLTGVSVVGMLLYVAGVFHLPINRMAVLSIFSAALVGLIVMRRRTAAPQAISHPLFARLLLTAAIAAIVYIAAIVPIRDYDGLVTWLPKARAIAIEGTIDGSYFQGKAGLNLHNRYPLLMPLNAAAIFVVSGSTDLETARWIFALLTIAALITARDLLGLSDPRTSAYIIGVVAWLPIMMLVDGGALSASNDIALMAFGGIGFLSINATSMGNAGVRAAAVFLPALILTKNEGVVFAAAIVLSAIVIRRLRSLREFATVAVPSIAALIVLRIWQQRVPAAYDEQYQILIQTLPERTGRLPDAVGALARHAIDPHMWGWFWPVVVTAAVVSLASACRRRAALPLLTIVIVAVVYTATLSVTSWQIDELARVAVPRLLLHLVIPAAALIAIAGEDLIERSGRTRSAL